MNAVAQLPVDISRSELLKLCAVDSIFYCRHFFPKTFRQESPDWHRDFWQKFDNPDYDFFAAEVYRGGGKTTLSRAGISKRIAYGVSRNILCVGISEAMSIHTIRWLKRQIENNHNWTGFFGLRKGNKWTDEWIEVYHEIEDCTINIIAKGMTSGLRGLNPDDWRPDFIFCDDISNEETTGTPEQLTKNRELFFGALVPTLAPKSEAPLRKLVLAQTGLNAEDIVYEAHKDPTFLTVKYPKLIEEHGVFRSAWPQRFPVDECIKEREAYIQRGQYHVYLREYGCKIISRETSPLQEAWLRYWKSLPTNLRFYLGLDPATDSQNKAAHRTAASVIGVNHQTGDVYLVSYKAQRGKNPDELWEWFLDMQLNFHPWKSGVETVAFQKFLKWYFEKKMKETQRFFHIESVNDKRPKPVRIMNAFALASHGKFWVHENMTDFVAGWVSWNEKIDWDLGDATAQAITLANPWMALASIEGEAEETGQQAYESEEAAYPDLVYDGGAP